MKMLYLALVLILSGFLSLKSQAQSPLQFTNVSQYQAVWEIPFDTNVVGFYLYLGTNKIDCSSNTYYRFWWTNCLPVVSVSSFDANGNESIRVYESNTIPVKMLPLKLNHPCAQGSINLRDWYDITNVQVPETQPQEFFRVIK